MQNPFKPNLPTCRPSPRGSIRKFSAPPQAPDADVLRAIVHRRLALRLGITMPVAAVIAALSGLGPNEMGGRR